MGVGSEDLTLAFLLHHDPDLHPELTEFVVFCRRPMLRRIFL
jgi:hypothetical protein